jgi:cytidyltransferase-like protein
MKIVGIIAEYNPFHNGHQYQIEQAKKITNADYVIVVMSGNFVQRGTPAILHKYARTEMALSHGADVVFELPVCYATASAEYFAFGAVTLLDQLGAIDYLCFGSECGDTASLTQIADFLLEEPAEYQNALKLYQKEGLTFPEARTKAVCKHLQKEQENADNIKNILSSPNNILGIEYIKAIKRCGSKMIPITIKREGAGYHSDDIAESFASATAIRKQLNQQEVNLSSVLSKLPLSTNRLLTKHYDKTSPITEDDFSSLLYYQLVQQSQDLTKYFDVSTDLANRIQNLISPSLSFTSFAETLKTKQITQTRINRALLHILLGITTPCMQENVKDHITYARILGFVTNSSEVLRKLKEVSSLPIITKVADAKHQLSPRAYDMLYQEINATHLYHQIIYSKFKTTMNSEFTMGPIRVTKEF